MNDALTPLDDERHRPSAEFRDFLEHEVTRDFRHQVVRRRWRGASLALISLALGSTAGLAAAQRQDGARRDSLLSSANADLSLSALRLELARAALVEAERKMKAGVMSVDALANMQAELRAMEVQARRAQLNIEEIRASAQSPRDELNAPRIGNRDFVQERLQLELMREQQRMLSVERAAAEIDRKVRAGAEDAIARRQAEVEMARVRSSLGALAEKQQLRREYLEKGTAVETLQRRLQEQETRLETSVALEALQLAEARMALVRKQRDAGAVDDITLLKAQLEMREQQVTLQRLQRQLEALRRREERRDERREERR